MICDRYLELEYINYHQPSLAHFLPFAPALTLLNAMLYPSNFAFQYLHTLLKLSQES